jgi:hypothetical protein
MSEKKVLLVLKNNLNKIILIGEIKKSYPEKINLKLHTKI